MSDLLATSEVARILRVEETRVCHWIKQHARETMVQPRENKRPSCSIHCRTLEQLIGVSIGGTQKGASMSLFI